MDEQQVPLPEAALRSVFRADESLMDTLTRITRAAMEGLGADAAGLTLLDAQERPTTAVFVDDVAPEVDQAQYATGRGPCLQAYRERRTIRLQVEPGDERWPEFAHVARSHGITSSLSLPLLVGPRSVGALNLYAHEPGRFDRVAETFGLAFAAQLAAAVDMGVAYWEKSSLAENLEAALASRAVIEQAKGILMATTRCTPEEAFVLLRAQSQAENVKLREIAVGIVGQQGP